MKILIIHNIFWSHYKAAVFTELASLCGLNGILLRVVHVSETEDIRASISQPESKLHQYPHKIIFRKSFQKTNLVSRFFSLLVEFFRFQPDILIVPGYFDLSWLLVAYFSKINKCKIILTSDSTFFDSNRFKIKEKIKKFLLRPFDCFFCYGSLAKEYLQTLGVSPEKIVVRFQATQNKEIIRIYNEKKDKSQLAFCEKNFIYVGRFSQEKNLLRLLKVYGELEGRGWGLVMVGSGPQENELKDLVKRQGFKNIFFVGKKSWREVIEYYVVTDVLVLPSLSEPWGVVVNEAMLCRLPVLVSGHCGASKDLVQNGQNGFVFDPTHDYQLKILMENIINNKYDLKAMGQKSYEIIQKYSPEEAARQMLEAVRGVANASRT